MMIGALFDMIGGWKQVKATAGFSYEISRNGKRRIVPIEGYRTRGLADQQWVDSGVFADDGLSERFRNFSYTPSRQPKRTRLAKVDFALNG
jgi:hypothetical protein